MPNFGGYSPGAERYGGAVPLLQRVLESLNKARGTAYNTSNTSTVWVENMAIARSIVDVWHQNQRLAYQNDPLRMTTTLARWESILGINPPPSDTPVERRARVAARFLRNGQRVMQAYVVDQLQAILGPVFVQIIHLDPGVDAVSWWPLTPSVDPVNVPWYSTVAKLMIKTQTPAGWTEAQYQNAVAGIFPLLDDIMPSWATWDYYRDGAGHSSSSWAKDPSAGFYLDEQNLNIEVFDI
jgi:uncharacterized protein YmfQ (DUF2313 family)